MIGNTNNNSNNNNINKTISKVKCMKPFFVYKDRADLKVVLIEQCPDSQIGCAHIS